MMVADGQWSTGVDPSAAFPLRMKHFRTTDALLPLGLAVKITALLPLVFTSGPHLTYSYQTGTKWMKVAVIKLSRFALL